MNIKIIVILIITVFTVNINGQNKNWVNYLQENRNSSFKFIEENYNTNINDKWIKHYERWKWKNKFLLDKDNKVISKNTIINNYKQTKSLNNIGNWAPLGPFSWTNGNSGYNPGNGRINAITVDPNNSNIIYACAASGGVWKSIDAGQTWNTTTDDMTILGTSDIVVNPQNSNILYLGTGDRDGFDTYGIGVLKSTDAGATWQPTGLYNDDPNYSYIINCLAINPENPEIIYAGTSNGLFRSTNAGIDWENIIEYGNFKQIKFNPLNSNTVYATDAQHFYKSYNGGDNFIEIEQGLPVSTTRIVMDVTPADSSYIYLLIAGTNSNFEGVFQSTNGANSFVKKVGLDDINLLGYDMFGDDDKTQAWYDLAIAVSPTNPLEIYTGGVNVWKSTNGGSDWEISSHWFYSSPSSYSHADIHSLDFYNNKLYCGSDGGAFVKSEDDEWSNISSGLNISQIYNFSNSEINTGIISMGAQDNGSNILDNNSWKHVMGADGMATIIDYTTPSTCYVSYQYGNIFRSNNYGNNMQQIFSPDDYNETGEWLTPYVLSHSNNGIMYVGCKNIYKTTNSGITWSAVTNLNSENFTVMAIAPSNSNYIYAAKEDLLIKTNDGGDNWEQVYMPNGGDITDIEVSTDNPEVVYLSLSLGSSPRVYKSTDACESYQEITNGLPPLAVNCIALENNEENGIYLGMELGVLYTNDNLDEWIQFSKNLPNVKITDIQILNSINKVRVASYGRGVWESELYGELTSINEKTITNKIDLYPNPTHNTLNINAKNFSKIFIYNSSGVLLKTFDVSNSTISYNTKNLVEGFYFVKAVDSSGKYTTKRFVKN